MEIDDYVERIKDYECPTAEGCKDLFLRIQEGDLKAREELIKGHLNYVVNVAERYYEYAPAFFRGELMDLVQAGNLGLIYAVDNFDPERNIYFISYCFFPVRTSIIKCISEDRFFGLYPSLNEILGKINEIDDFSVYKTGRDDTLITQMLNEKKVYVNYSRGARPFKEVRVSKMLDKIALTDVEFLGFNDVPGGEEIDISFESEAERLNGFIEKYLNERQKEVLFLRFNQGLSLKEAGEVIGVSNERVRQIQVEALSKLRRRYDIGF